MKSSNNFNLIRLFAALQVAIVHSASYLNIDIQYLKFLDLFPGVPIFFFISGFLMIKSFKKNFSQLLQKNNNDLLLTSQQVKMELYEN